MKIKLLIAGLYCCCLTAFAQDNTVEQTIHNYFENYTAPGYKASRKMGTDSIRIISDSAKISIYANEPFCSQLFTSEQVKQVYRDIHKLLPDSCRKFKTTVFNKYHTAIEDLVPNLLRTDNKDNKRLWGHTDYKGQPWVTNTSRAYQVSRGLQNRHLFIWASHGRYYKEGIWKWQRPYLFCTTEDLFTQSFVYPYLFPMLENAGAIIGSPRERDYQKKEAVVDNDHPQRKGRYFENSSADYVWQSSCANSGFASSNILMNDSVFPFKLGTYRFVDATKQQENLATSTWVPEIPRAGQYAVYVSYASRPNSIPDARYTVYHKGGKTTFKVNQQMGGSTWVYLGTFEFDQNQPERACVILDNHSEHKGIVTADGVRFGGGLGQIERGFAGTSGIPRFMECARYYAQWAGIPDSLVNTEQSRNDYADDLRVRGNMLNYLAGGSAYLPDREGQRVPFELSLALHSDAGMRKDQSVFGTLSISTTHNKDNETFFPTGMKRQASSDFAALLPYNIRKDISRTFNIPWIQREHWDRNYAETRMPEVPSAILEMLSHQNYTDMKYGHDPFFKFALSRSVYKTILRFVNNQHGINDVVVQPLPVGEFAAVLSDDGKKVKLSWTATKDSLEKSAAPKGYILYTKIGDGGFDNGVALGNAEKCEVLIAPNKRYSFKITAVNEGGESFPSETLSAYYAGPNAKKVLIVNGFTRLSGPARIETEDKLGFDLDEDLGVPYLKTTAFAGRQLIFDKSRAGWADTASLGFSGKELIAKEIAGNTFDYPVCHGEAIAYSNQYSYSSMSRKAFEENDINAGTYAVIDYIAGLEGDFKHNLKPFNTFPTKTQQKLTNYLKHGGALLVSGSYIGSDNIKNEKNRDFIEKVLKFKYDGTARQDSTGMVNGLNLQFPIFRTWNSEHYAVQAPDAILPADGQAFSSFAYGGGQGAGIAYKGKDYRVIAMGFPFECIREAQTRKIAMKAILSFLTD